MLNSIPTSAAPNCVAITLQGGRTVRVKHDDLGDALAHSKPAVRLTMFAKYGNDVDAGRELWRTVTSLAGRQASLEDWQGSETQIRNVGFLSLLGTVWSVLCQNCDGKGTAADSPALRCSECDGKGTTEFTNEQAGSLLGVSPDVYRATWSPRVLRLRSMVSEWEQDGLAHAVLFTATFEN
jgi:hypothetical protein